MKPIKVLQITQSLGGGVQKYVVQLCQSLNRNRFYITGCCSRGSNGENKSGDIPFAEAFREAGVPYFVVPMQRSINFWKDFFAFLKIYQNIRRNRFDIVHAHSSKAGVLARIAARMAGVPVVVYSPHAFSFNKPGHFLKKLPYIFFEKMASFFGDSIITDSPTEKNLALKFRIDRKEKIAVIPPSIELQDYHSEISEQERKEGQEKLGVSEGHKVVTMVSRLVPQKDPVTFILASHYLKKQFPRVTFLLVGDGPLMDKCLRMIREFGLDGQMKVLGWRRDYKMVLRLSDVLVSSSLWEGLPFIILEAMAFSKPVVATRSTGTVDVINDGDNGFLVPPRSPVFLAEKIKWVLTQPGVAAKAGKAARKTVEKQYCLKKNIPLMEQTYIQLFNKSKKG